ncbi:MAG TPA: tetratricopeptide repeat protein [bacterium]|nr:tetratricopeptide repeat protein [bacterium]
MENVELSELWLLFVFVAITIEYYFLAINKYSNDEIEKSHFFILSAAALLSLLIQTGNNDSFPISLFSLFLLPMSYITLRLFVNFHIKETDYARFQKDVGQWQKKIKINPDDSDCHIALGDLYMENDESEKALKCYRKAYELDANPYVYHKMKLASKEVLIQKGELWICRECGRDNAESSERCADCGASRKVLTSLKEDIRKNREDIKKWILKGFSTTFAIILAFGLLKLFAPSLCYTVTSISLFLFLAYLVLKKFLTW